MKLGFALPIVGPAVSGAAGLSLARRLLLFYELCAYISLRVHWKVYFRHVLHIHRSQGIPLSAGIRISWQIS